jgi:hypothetical protein
MLVPLCLLWIIALAMPATAARNESFWDIVLRIAGISANPDQLKGPGDEVEAGDVCVVNLAELGRYSLRRDGGYHSPLFRPEDADILVLKDHTLVRIPVSGGEAESLYTIPGSIKLIGFSMDDPDKVLVLVQGNEDSLSVGLLSLKSGQVKPLSYDKQSADDQLLLAHLQGWERVYTDTKVYVKHESKMGMAGLEEWTDVYYKRGDNDPVNLSKCNGDYCGQPSLSHDRRQVVFIRVAY